MPVSVLYCALYAILGTEIQMALRDAVFLTQQAGFRMGSQHDIAAGFK